MRKQFQEIGRKIIELLTEITFDEERNERFFGDFGITYRHKGDYSDIENIVISFCAEPYMNRDARISISPDGNKVKIYPNYKVWKKDVLKDKVGNYFATHVYKSVDELLRKEGFTPDDEMSLYQR